MKFNKNNIFFGMILTVIVIGMFGFVSAVLKITDNGIVVNNKLQVSTASCTVDSGGTGDYTTIQGCIDSLQYGGNIFVKDGSYSETLVFSRGNYSLIAQSYNTILTLKNTENFMIKNSVNAIKNIKISGFTFMVNHISRTQPVVGIDFSINSYDFLFKSNHSFSNI